ncbi:hypothetical protein Lal_00002685 [Lupinus albus]|nr:hypothetical protein Lal_00002685 [Lupinus albus]
MGFQNRILGQKLLDETLSSNKFLAMILKSFERKARASTWASKILGQFIGHSLSASNLLDRDIASKSDPMVVVYSKKKDGIVEELGRTEVILNYLNPQWIQKINVTFQFEIVQQLEFHVYDVDTQYHCIPTMALKLRDQDFLGMANCTLSEIVTKQSQRLTLKLQSKNGYNGSRNLGTLNVHAEETISSRNAVEMIFSCTTLDNKDIFSKTDPFIRISRIVESGSSVPICKTEVIDNNLSPAWKPLCLISKQFGSKENPLIIECFDFNSNGNHVLVGDAAWDWHGTNQEIKRKESDEERLNKMGPAPNIGVDHTPVKEDLKLINLSKPTKGQQ